MMRNRARQTALASVVTAIIQWQFCPRMVSQWLLPLTMVPTPGAMDGGCAAPLTEMFWYQVFGVRLYGQGLSRHDRGGRQDGAEADTARIAWPAR